MYYFLHHSKKAKNWPNHFISGKPFQKRPNGNFAFCKPLGQPFRQFTNAKSTKAENVSTVTLKHNSF